MKVFICLLALAVKALAEPQVFNGNNNGIGGEGYRYNQPVQGEGGNQHENSIQEDQGQTVRIIKEEIQPPKVKTLKIIHEREPEIKTIQIVRQHPPPPPLIKHVKILRQPPPPPPEIKTVSVVHQPLPPPPEIKQLRLVHPPPIVKVLAAPAPWVSLGPWAASGPWAATASAPVIHQSLGASPAIGMGYGIDAAPISSASVPIPVSASPGNVQVLPSSLGASSYLGSSAVENEPLSSSGISGLPATYGAPAVQVLESAPAPAAIAPGPAPPQVLTAPAPISAPIASASAPVWNTITPATGSYGLPVYGASSPILEAPIGGEELKYFRLIKK